jgi:hypothetical protein
MEHKKSFLITILCPLLTILILEILSAITFTGATIVSSILYSITDIKLVAIASIIIVLFIGGGAIISAFIYMAKMTANTSPKRFLSIIIGALVAGLYLYLTITSPTPIDATDNFITIPILVYDLPVIIYGLLTILFSFGDTDN